MKPQRFAPWFLLSALILAGCASVQRPVASEACAEGNAANPSGTLASDLIAVTADSTLDISFYLGHSVHQYLVQARPDMITGRVMVDHELIKERSLDKLKYWELFHRVSVFVADSTQRHLASDTPCRTPYLIHLRVGEGSQTLGGCRTGVDGAILSKLTRDAEFLVYSKK